ncbi:MAG: hypothetical protein FJ144_23500 [Deltaproteobacteria bacterium]|nr:hypothetical protein [Deltaproteobacteria bacterium]
MSHSTIVVALAVLLGLVLPARSARAHGDWGHVHVTGWAIENLPPGELRSFFSDPEVFNAALFGAAFPDSGYWGETPASREYGEHSHWEPFVEDAIELLRSERPPLFWTREDRKLVAFLMGCAAHGLQDEIFDSLFLFQVEENDGGGQDEADPGTDFFLIDDGLFRFVPREYVPMDVLLRLYAGLPQTITEDVVRAGVDVQTRTYINDGIALVIARSLVDEFRAILPWSQHHYLDPAIPGSLVAEIEPTKRHIEALWDRLHGRFTDRDLVVHAYPERGRLLRSGSATTVDSWITLVFGKAPRVETVTGSLRDATGNVVPFELVGTRWGHPFPRLVRFQPRADLVPGGRYTVTLDAGAELIDGSVTTEPATVSFRVACAEGDASCPRGTPRVPLLDGSARREGGSCRRLSANGAGDLFASAAGACTPRSLASRR